MNRVHILFSTESGNAEMAADDIAAAFESGGYETVIADVSVTSVEALADMSFAVVVTSTYGEGELPGTAGPFHEKLLAERPDLSHLRFGAFGLGDSVYETFNNAVDILCAAFTEMGAQQIGETAKHDANALDDVSDLAPAWVEKLTSLLSSSGTAPTLQDARDG
ncbi:flavodoxin domain-containing protein [Rhodococcus sp. (in: high G+C Gram-positive bacteria)]|uniref:flavodoxin domain-containing protein n=1 Tax=Rhodococcus sp. TaxID=1831 RepID=UPI00257945CC|nr:flavodoxin domain-containing protein [Rhodococcus sp. (in: high G+C Gram-positive bacteria)]MBQ7806090.1 flavodoxin domain-containing protein [Rhodococcus sp. (in: high G+C Gram-positive bacteria)]